MAPDAGERDAVAPDAVAPDAVAPDAGEPDAVAPDAETTNEGEHPFLDLFVIVKLTSYT